MLYGTFKQLLRAAEMMGEPENCSLETMDSSGYRLDRIRISGKTAEGIRFQMDMSLSGEPVKAETPEAAAEKICVGSAAPSVCCTDSSPRGEGFGEVTG